MVLPGSPARGAGGGAMSVCEGPCAGGVHWPHPRAGAQAELCLPGPQPRRGSGLPGSWVRVAACWAGPVTVTVIHSGRLVDTVPVSHPWQPRRCGRLDGIPAVLAGKEGGRAPARQPSGCAQTGPVAMETPCGSRSTDERGSDFSWDFPGRLLLGPPSLPLSQTLPSGPTGGGQP